MSKKFVSLDELTRYDSKFKDYISNILSSYELTSNKVTSVSSSSTNTQYPSAKCVYDSFMRGMFIAKYGTTAYADVLAAYQKGWVVYCRASSSSNPASGSQLRMAFLAYVNDETTPTEFEFQYYRSVSTHSDSTQGDEVYVYKLNSSSGWSVTKRNAYTKIAAGTGLSSSYESGTLTITNSMDASDYLSKTNTTSYTPTADYHPATKKYVDDQIAAQIGSINTILATLTTPSNNGGGE